MVVMNMAVTIAFIGEGEVMSKNRIDTTIGREIIQYIFPGKSLSIGGPTLAFNSRPLRFLLINIVARERKPEIP